MDKDELERIRTAYYSGLKVQIWFNGYWEDFDARDYSMYKDSFSENRQYRIVGSDYADMAEKQIAEKDKQIAELEKENANLKALRKYEVNVAKVEIEKLEKENAELKERNGELAGQKASLERWFGEAKGLLKRVIEWADWQSGSKCPSFKEIEKDIKAFLEE